MQPTQVDGEPATPKWNAKPSTEEEFHTEIARLDYENEKIEVSERLKYVNAYAQSTLRGLTLANGGAIIALYTFIGGSNAHFDRQGIWWAFGWFAGGLATTLTASFLAFVTQGYYLNAAQRRMWDKQAEMLGGTGENNPGPIWGAGNRFELAATLAALTGLICFGIGGGVALAAVLV